MLRLDRMGRDYAVNHARHEYNEVETDEERSYTEGNTPTEDTHPPEPGPPEEFGTQRPQSRE
jgi:hypothetical protein